MLLLSLRAPELPRSQCSHAPRRARPTPYTVKLAAAVAAVAGLTAAAAQLAARDGLLYITMANSHVLDFALNWVDHMVLLDAHNFLVGAHACAPYA